MKVGASFILPDRVDISLHYRAQEKSYTEAMKQELEIINKK